MAPLRVGYASFVVRHLVNVQQFLRNRRDRCRYIDDGVEPVTYEAPG